MNILFTPPRCCVKRPLIELDKASEFSRQPLVFEEFAVKAMLVLSALLNNAASVIKVPKLPYETLA